MSDIFRIFDGRPVCHIRYRIITRNAVIASYYPAFGLVGIAVSVVITSSNSSKLLPNGATRAHRDVQATDAKNNENTKLFITNKPFGSLAMA